MSETTTGGQPPMFICGPTTGCGKLTPMEQFGAGWRTPKRCIHCGKRWRFDTPSMAINADGFYEAIKGTEDSDCTAGGWFGGDEPEFDRNLVKEAREAVREIRQYCNAPMMRADAAFRTNIALNVIQAALPAWMPPSADATDTHYWTGVVTKSRPIPGDDSTSERPCYLDKRTHDPSCTCDTCTFPATPATPDEINEWEYENENDPRPNPITTRVRLARVIAAYRAASLPVSDPGDTERLDWLDENHTRVYELFGDMCNADAGETIRALIDAARSAARPQEEG